MPNNMIDIRTTTFMEGVIREKPQVYTFLRDRYFGERDVFTTEEVLIDYDDGAGNVLAPFVVPRVGKVPMERGGFETRRLAPAYIAPSRVLTVDVLKRRMAGENLFSQMTPAERARYYVVDDLDFLDKTVTRREEWMCAETMLDNACTMEHIGDQADKSISMTAKFYDGDKNPGVFKPTKAWAVGTATKRGTWYDEVCKQIESMTAAGREVTDLVMGAEVGGMVMFDPWIVAMMDNRRMDIAHIDPRWQPNGVTSLGPVNFSGVTLELFIDRGTYQERNAKGVLTTKPYFPAKAAMLAAPGTGKLRNGAVTQKEMDGETYTRFGSRVPKHLVHVDTNSEETILTSAPIAAPKMKGQWRSCRDVFTV